MQASKQQISSQQVEPKNKTKVTDTIERYTMGQMCRKDEDLEQMSEEQTLDP
jgi:hypothetical protein